MEKVHLFLWCGPIFSGYAFTISTLVFCRMFVHLLLVVHVATICEQRLLHVFLLHTVLLFMVFSRMHLKQHVHTTNVENLRNHENSSSDFEAQGCMRINADCSGVMFRIWSNVSILRDRVLMCWIGRESSITQECLKLSYSH